MFDVYRNESHNRKQRGALYAFELQQKYIKFSQLEFSFHTFHLKSHQAQTILCACALGVSALFRPFAAIAVLTLAHFSCISTQWILRASGKAYECMVGWCKMLMFQYFYWVKKCTLAQNAHSFIINLISQHIHTLLWTREQCLQTHTCTIIISGSYKWNNKSVGSEMHAANYDICQKCKCIFFTALRS